MKWILLLVPQSEWKAGLECEDGEGRNGKKREANEKDEPCNNLEICEELVKHE